MWTTENRARYKRDHLRYPSDTTDEEWHERAALIPPARRGGRKRRVNIREVLDGLLDVLSTGCQGRAIPKDFPPRSTIFDYFGRWEADGAYRGPQFREGVAKVRPQLATAIITRHEQVKGCVAWPKRWLVERTLAWLNRNRRLAKDFENRIRYAVAFVHLASIRLMVRKLCNPS